MAKMYNFTWNSKMNLIDLMLLNKPNKITSQCPISTVFIPLLYSSLTLIPRPPNFKQIKSAKSNKIKLQTSKSNPKYLQLKMIQVNSFFSFVILSSFRHNFQTKEIHTCCYNSIFNLPYYSDQRQCRSKENETNECGKSRGCGCEDRKILRNKYTGKHSRNGKIKNKVNMLTPSTLHSIP